MTCIKMVLLPKVERYLRGVVLVEVIWKVFTYITKNCLCSSITQDDALYESRQGRGSGTSTLEENLVQHIAGICHNPLLRLFLDMRKVCDLLDHTRFMEVLKGYGLGPKLRRLKQRVWEDQAVVPKAGRYYV